MIFWSRSLVDIEPWFTLQTIGWLIIWKKQLFVNEKSSGETKINRQFQEQQHKKSWISNPWHQEIWKEREQASEKNKWWRWDSNPRTRRTAALTQRVWPLRYVILLHFDLSQIFFIMFALLYISKLLHPFTQEIVLVYNCFVSFNKQMKDYIYWKLKNPEIVI